MKKCLLLMMLFVSTLAMTAQEKKKKKCPADEGYVKAVVIKYEVEACGYLLEIPGKTKNDPKIKLQPQSMPDSFKQHKKKVWVKYRVPKTQPMTTCMAGQIVEIEDMKKR
jgi:hypothetical protein